MIAILAFVLVAGQGPQAVLGADQVLQRLGTQVEKPARSDGFSKIEAEVKAFNAASGSMTPEAAAAGWLKIRDHWEAASETPAYQYGEVSQSGDLKALLTALPRPAAWPIIRTSLRKLPLEGSVPVLLILFDRLLGDDAQMVKDCEKFYRKPGDSERPGGDWMERRQVLNVELQAAVRARNADLMGRVLEEKARTIESSYDETVPDVVALLGQEKARAVLKRYLERASKPVQNFSGAETRKLAREIMLSDLAHVKTPQWSLAEGPDAAALVSKLVAKFGVKSLGEDSCDSHAGAYYLADLLRQNRIQDAAKFLTGTNRNQVDFSPVGIKPEGLYAQISQVLDCNPAAALWDEYYVAAATLNKTPEVHAKLEKALASNTLKPQVRRRLLTTKGDFAAAEGDEKAATEAYIEASKVNVGRASSMDIGAKLILIAEATGSPEATEAEIKLSEAPSEEPYYYGSDAFDLFVDQGRLADAQRYVLRQAKSLARQANAYETYEPVLKLAEVYYRAGRPADVAELLSGFTAWPEADLFKILTLRREWGCCEAQHNRSLGFYAAWAFAGTDKKELAVRTLHDLLRYSMEDDDAYELLNQVEGAPALDFYDELAKTDPFAPRPLAWKADLLMKLGRLDEAEALARKSIAMDPTDGQAPAGRRLTSYSILGRILRAEGKNDDAAVYERVVKAVRMSEKSDLYREAGLLPQALKLYGEASDVFADAYCIHARTALVLLQQGHTAEAVEHFKRAYELMPYQFGEIESLCFGCENTFESDLQRHLARDVFEKLAKEHPDKPQVHYLLGQIYMEEGDAQKALACFETAVHLDPRYFNAWKDVLALAEQGSSTDAQCEEACLAVTRLDPMGLHGEQDAMARAGDCSALWQIFADAYASLPPPPEGPLFPLRQQTGRNGRTWYAAESSPAASDLRKGPGGGFASIKEISDICDLPRVSGD